MTINPDVPQSAGVPPSGSGHSRAEPEEVSALRASVPNAEVTCKHCGHTAVLTPDRAQISFMTDGHFFLRVPPLMPDQIVEWVCDNLRTDEGEGQNWTRYGMLCAVRITAKGRDIRTVGQHVHCRGGSEEHIGKFRTDAQAWIDAIYADPAASRLITASAIEARRAETQGGSVADESAVAKPDARTVQP